MIVLSEDSASFLDWQGAGGNSMDRKTAKGKSDCAINQ